MAVNADHYALVVGIDDYPDFNPLNGAKNDANAFAAWLQNDAIGGGVPDDNLELVLSESDPVQPIQDDIDDALKRLFDSAKDNAASRLYIYFSGHGVAHTAFATNLCLAKWSKRRTGAALDSMNYLECAVEMGVFDEIVLFMDCCRTRTRGRNALHYQFPPITPGPIATKTFVGYATEYLLAAHEATVIDEDTLPDDDTDEVRGHFTRALIEALEGHAARPQGGVTASALKKYLDARTVEIASTANHRQRPEIQDGLDSHPEPVFGSAVPIPDDQQNTVTVRILFGQNRVGPMRFEDGNLDSLQEGLGSDGPWQISGLKRGTYAIVDIGTDEYKTVRITGDEQEVVDVQFD